MRLILIIFIGCIFLGCSRDPYEKEFINEFNKKEDYGGYNKKSIVDLANETEEFLINHSYLSEVSQDEYFNLINQLLTKELIIDLELRKKSNPYSYWILTTPGVQVTILRYGNKIIDENPSMPKDHPIRIIAKNANDMIKKNDMANINSLMDMIYSMSPEELEKIHYHLYPLAIIERIIEENSR